ncbi:MAG: pyridoxal-phosphate dependent enzyme, partial [Firmicutes bacterium]|nr:pyridoxal-phosphate dependent enzyme [Bacillota bacterium]
PSIRCYIVAPCDAARLAGKPVTNPNHKIQGGGYNMELPLVEDKLVDGYLSVTDEEATRATRDLARYEGIFAGFSSGANIAAALRLLSGIEKGKTVALTINDSGLKYLSTDLWQ